MKNTFAFLLTFLIFSACSTTVDTTQFSPEQHFDYAKSLFDEEQFQEAGTEFQSILLQYPGSTINDDAQYYLGLSYFKQEQFLLGAYEFSKLIRDMPASSFLPDAQFMLADAYYELSPDYRLDQVYSEKAIKEFQSYIDFFPTSEKVSVAEIKIDELHNKIAEKEFTIAELYKTMEYYESAKLYYEIVLNRFYDTPYAAKSMLGKATILLEQGKIESGLKELENIKIKYPDSEIIDVVDQLIIEFSAQNGENNG